MAKSFQHQKPPSRVDLTLDVETGDAQERVELPLRLMVVSDLTGKQEDMPVAEREVVNVTNHNFEGVMESYDLGIEPVVPDKLTGEGDMKVELEFDTLDDFEPQQVAQQVPELSRLLAARNLLKDLRNRIISMREFRERLEEIVRDEELRKELLGELQDVVPDEQGDESASAQAQE